MIPTFQLGGALSARKPPASGGASDPNFSNVVLLMHGNGADNGTTFTDSSASNRSFTRFGNAKTSTTQKKYGTASMYFDGTGDYLETAYSTTDFQWWGSDYTIEAWVYPTTLSEWSYTNTIPGMIGNGDPIGGTVYWAFGPRSDGAVTFYYWRGDQSFVTSTETVSANTWSHIAMTHKSGSGIKIWVNGVGTGSYTAVVGTPQHNSGPPLGIGSMFTADVQGYIDDLRITKGVERYTSNFTPPTAEFPDS